METMFKDPTRVPGDLGFDPLGLSVGQSKEGMERMQVRDPRRPEWGGWGGCAGQYHTPFPKKRHGEHVEG